MSMSYGLKKSGRIVQLASVPYFWLLVIVVVSDCFVTTNYKIFSVVHNKHLLSSYVCGFIGMSLVQVEDSAGSDMLHMFYSEVQGKGTATT